MFILAIETASDVCAIALLDDDAVAVQASIAVPRSHGRRLAPLIQEALAHAGRSAADLDLVGVSIGPGSYTGLRIGLGVAKGLAVASGAEIVGVPTLRALADGSHGPVAAVLPSRRGEVYAAVYDGGAEVRPPTALAVAEAEGWLPADLAGIGGPGADRLAGVRPAVARVALAPSAVAVGRLARRLHGARGADDVGALVPAYLKPVAASRPRGIFSSPNP
ncbi:tRNA (adenosine(37)-N6)-threonylcarbamoyltransferase complex dimerization subunit type 1 TsaB [Rubrivirga sp. IMCC45206]|uniref:tRNA (adenosine(37)-N6)-threonylcarbamoyltransferase complex dimerization subunit type 1 TsaB n=1 Tax=Rubrivirga sp. IMCC45206 TaxID=3391614 RepID=UPI0039900597